MVCWFLFGSVFGIWNVFQSPGLDFRLVALGALFPVVVDLPWGEEAYGHTLLSAVVVLALTMMFTAGRGHRLRRRRALGFAIGWFSGLVLGGAWLHQRVFWWPAFGVSRPHAPLFAPGPVIVIEELLGLAAAWWVWSRFGLADPDRRRALWRTGRLSIVMDER